MERSKNRLNPGWIGLIVAAGLASLALLVAYLVQGKNIALFNPKGEIAQEQHSLMMFTVTVLFAVAIPTLSVAFFVAWKYRDTNTKTVYTTNARVTAGNRSKYLVLLFWLIPTSGIILIASTMWPATHRLAPQNSITSDSKPLQIQVISLRWKWLFIYPEQGIATVNFVQIPVNTPVQFEMTADETPMSSFWIPNLGGQLYTMTSHVNRLNLIADTAGDYPGSTPEINGAGFTGMKFTARADTQTNFDQWVQQVKESPNSLEIGTYEKLVEPSENNPVAFYSGFNSNIFDNVIMKYTGTSEGHMDH